MGTWTTSLTCTYTFARTLLPRLLAADQATRIEERATLTVFLTYSAATVSESRSPES